MAVQMQYQRLRDEFINISKAHVTPEALEEIKSEYSYDINSKRKISNIKNLKKLIETLEKCCILNYDDIKVLYYIQKKYINASNLENKLKNYEEWFESLNSTLDYNMYLHDNVEPSTSHDQQTCDRTRIAHSLEDCRYACKLNQVSEQLETCTCKAFPEPQDKYTITKFQQKVILKISEQLGRSWKDVCRYMGLKEYQIDEIQSRYPYDLKEQSFQGLQICISQYDSEWKMNMLNALEKGRRKDIKEKVEKVFLCD